MEEVDGAQVFQYREEVIVEVHGTDEQGALDVVTYQVDYGEDDRTLLPKGPLEDEHATHVREVLEREGLRLGNRDD